uniref:Uncharacterized protein n=1 Tax=Panagrolaimus superbus TaxID=310955 RepID=A0A914Z4X6_9BILA
MGPLPKEPAKDDKKDLPNGEDYEQNGWQIGYQVQLHGAGIEGMVNEIDVEDSDSDGYEGPGEGSDAEVHDNERAGYQQIPFSVVTSNEFGSADKEEESSQPKCCEPSEDEFNVFEEKIKTASAPLPGTLPSTIQMEVEELKLNANQVHLKDTELMASVPSSRSKIELDDAKIDEIKVAVSKISLPPPPWAKDVDDEKLKQMLQNIKSGKF